MPPRAPAQPSEDRAAEPGGPTTRGPLEPPRPGELTRLLRALTVLEGLAALALSFVLIDAGLPGPAACAIAFATPFGVHAGVIAAEFIVAAALSAPTPPGHRIGAARAVAMVLHEAVQSIRVFQWEQPWGRHPIPLGPVAGSPGRIPVLLVHGYACNRRVWRRMAEALARRGHPLAFVDLEPVFGGIDEHTGRIAQAVRDLRARTGAVRVALLAHSMGGLACRAYLRQSGHADVAGLVTLGTPHQGTALARFGRGENARQMRPDSGWLAALSRHEAGGAGPGLSCVVVLTHHDNLLAPRVPQDIPGARRVELEGIGHLGLVESARVREIVIGALDGFTAGPRDAGPGGRGA